jgi:hypothetical protein
MPQRGAVVSPKLRGPRTQESPWPSRWDQCTSSWGRVARERLNPEAPERFHPTGDVIRSSQPGPWSHCNVRRRPSSRRGGRGASLAAADGRTNAGDRVLRGQMATANSKTSLAGTRLAGPRRHRRGCPGLPPQVLGSVGRRTPRTVQSGLRLISLRAGSPAQSAPTCPPRFRHGWCWPYTIRRTRPSSWSCRGRDLARCLPRRT